MRRCPWRGALAIGVIALAPGSGAQAAEQTYRFSPWTPRSARSARRRGTAAAARTKLATNKAHKYNAGDGNDTLIGGNKDDILNGGRGNDKVFGGGGNDVVCGGVDNDKVFGEEGNDRVFGEEDNDFLDGGEGNDKLNGQAGLDRLVGFMKTKGKIVDAGQRPARRQLRGRRPGRRRLRRADRRRRERPPLLPHARPGRETMDGGIGNDTIIGSEADDRLPLRRHRRRHRSAAAGATTRSTAAARTIRSTAATATTT